MAPWHRRVGCSPTRSLACSVVKRLSRGHAPPSTLNVEGAYLEVAADATSSVGVIVAALLEQAADGSQWDTVVAMLVGTFVAVRAIGLGRHLLAALGLLAVLGQHAPEGLDFDGVTAGLTAVPGVADVHDLHPWILTSA